MMCGVLMGNAFISHYRPQTRKHALPAACCGFTLLISGLGGWGAGEKQFSGGGDGNRGLTKLPHHREGNIQARVHDALLAALAGTTARKDEARARPAGSVGGGRMRGLQRGPALRPQKPKQRADPGHRQQKALACLLAFWVGFNRLKNNWFILRFGGKRLFEGAAGWHASLPFDPAGQLVSFWGKRLLARPLTFEFLGGVYCCTSLGAQFGG